MTVFECKEGVKGETELNRENGLGLESEKMGGAVVWFGNNSNMRISCHDLRDDPFSRKLAEKRKMSGLEALSPRCVFKCSFKLSAWEDVKVHL